MNQIGRIIRSSVRSVDQAFRYSGDEFAVILPETAVNDAYTVKILSEPVAEARINARGSGLSSGYTLAAAVDAKDPYAVALAEAIGLAPEEISKNKHCHFASQYW